MRCVQTSDSFYEKVCEQLLTEKKVPQNEEALKAIIWQLNGNLDVQQLESCAQEVWWRIHRYDFLTPFLEDPDVSEIMLNGTSHLFVEKQGKLIEYETNVSENRAIQLVQKMLAEVNKSVNLKEPVADARLKDGSRINVVLKPIAINGPLLTVRKFKKQLSRLEALRALDAMTTDQLNFLKRAVAERKSIVVSGGTSTGKTTLLNCLCAEIGENERVITAEDSAELNLSQIKNLAILECRESDNPHIKPISLRQLIKMALRMRPDRIIVGEIRGAEAFEMLQALNTGHPGSMSTGHSNTAKDMLMRIESMALMAEVPLGVIKAQIGSGIDYIVHLERTPKGKRYISEIIHVLSDSVEGYKYETMEV